MSVESSAFYDIQDSTGKWFLGKIIANDSSVGGVNVHFWGYPSKFDIVISNDEKEKRITKASSKTTEIRVTSFDIGDSVDVFVEIINRWEKLKVLEKSPCGEKMRVGFQCSPWINIGGENVFIAGTRTSNPKYRKYPFPSGIENALLIASSYFRDGTVTSKRIASMIYEELCRFKLLPEEKCLQLFKSCEKGDLYPLRMMPESIRYLNAKAASMLAAIDVDYELIENEDADEEDADDNHLNNYNFLSDEPFIDSSVTGVNQLLRYFLKFRIALLDNWSTLSSLTQYKLELADYLEVCALKKSNSAIQRRVLFAEAALLIEDVKISHLSKRPLQDACNFRLARHYINGLGIDITDPAHQDAADIQAGEYLLRSKGNEYVCGLLGILLSVGRTAITTVIANDNTSCTFIFKNLFEVSILAGAQSSCFWKAKLLFDGWGLQSRGSERITQLQEARRLFTQCQDFHFMVKESQLYIQRISGLLSAKEKNRYIDKPSYLVALYIFAKILQSQVTEKFNETLLRCIKKFAHEEQLPGPSVEADHAMADWITDLSPRVFTAMNSLNIKGKEDLLETQNTMICHRMYQKFREIFTVPFKVAKKKSIYRKVVKMLSFSSPSPSPSASSSSSEAEETTKSWSRELILHLLTERIFPLVVKVKHIYGAYSGLTCPVEEASVRMGVADVAIPNVRELWNVNANSIADMIYENINPNNRHLTEQMAVADNVMETLTSLLRVQSAVEAVVGASNTTTTITTTDMHTLLLPVTLPVNTNNLTSAITTKPISSLYCVIQIVKQARELAHLSREAEPDIMNKHTHSAEALLNYARKENITVQIAMQQLDNLYIELTKGVGGLDGYPTRVGYHTIINAINVNTFLQSQSAQVQQVIEKRVSFLGLPQNSNINNLWRDNLDNSLLFIFERFRTMVTTKMDSTIFKTLCDGAYTPLVNYPAVTYADPWSSLSLVNIDDVFKHLISDEVIAALPEGTAMTREDAIQQILYDCISEKFRLLKVNFPALLGYCDQSARLLLIKKMMYFLIMYPDMDWNNKEKKKLLALHLTNGLGGRCPDGISQFCDEFIEKAERQRNDAIFATMPPEVSRMILSLVSMLEHIKQHFISQHLSCLKRHYEGRTIGTLTLKIMLLLPLSLKGEFGIVKYPSYGAQGHSGRREQMQSEEVCQRFLNGGILKYDYGEEVFVEGMSLYRLVTLFRNSIIKKDGVYKRPTAERFNNDCELRNKLYFIISEDIVEGFVSQDVLLSSYYNLSKSLGYSCENLFFNAIIAEADEGGDAIELLRPLIARVMKDAVIVRILEVAQFVIVYPEFWNYLSNNWKITQDM